MYRLRPRSGSSELVYATYIYCCSFSIGFKLCFEDANVDYDERFCLYMTSRQHFFSAAMPRASLVYRLPNPHFSPELSAKTTVFSPATHGEATVICHSEFLTG